ncbi:NUDIX domain-containing protein [Brevibacterium casei]|uniref:NUDIX domain-containing protein n=1 Tax=Brevibacterium casei TaxID=33889 RepID=UPI0011A6745E|nr:NUDIX domain-containing protein [Brevibacterium casei]MCT1765820.1 NUDIX domain-containing protein [Brevibacterium casei]
MTTIRAASVVIVDNRSRVLLVQRGRNPDKGRWSVPGGKCEPGESFAEAAAREAYEETGLRVEIGRELWSLTIPIGDGVEYDVHDFAATVTGGELSAGDDAAEARWFAEAELDALDLTHDLAGYLRRAEVFGPGTAAR